jgi:predicted nucleic acid-binding protein
MEARSDQFKDFAALVQTVDNPLAALLTKIVEANIIIDANIAIRALRWMAVKRTNPSAKPEILEIAETGYAKIHAPLFIDDEIREHLPEIIEASGKSAEEIERLWLEFREKLHLHDTSSLPPLPTETNNIDPDDAPYIQLQQKLSHHIISEDKHIPSIGGRTVQLVVIKRLKDLYRANATEYQFAITGYGVLVLGSHLIPGLIAILKNALDRIIELPGWAHLLIILSIVHIYNDPRLKEKFSSILEGVALLIPELTTEILKHTADSFSKLNDAKQKAADIAKEFPADFKPAT